MMYPCMEGEKGPGNYGSGSVDLLSSVKYQSKNTVDQIYYGCGYIMHKWG